jgi:hypothetical protein
LGLRTVATGSTRRRAEQAAAQLLLNELSHPKDPSRDSIQ